MRSRFHVLDRYAEAELSGTGRESRFPGVAAHVRRCVACHQDYQGLLAAVEGLHPCAQEIVRAVPGAMQVCNPTMRASAARRCPSRNPASANCTCAWPEDATGIKLDRIELCLVMKRIYDLRVSAPLRRRTLVRLRAPSPAG